jgi:lipopolysaccharide/colanic/teichoic acid biosynthesis glycosyltransferase
MAFRNEENEFDDSDIEEQYLDHILPQKLKLSLDYWRSRTFVSDVNILIGTVLGSTNSKRGLIEVQRKGKAPTHK